MKKDFPEPLVWPVASIGGKVFVDVGANNGVFTVPLWRHYRKILAIEPNPGLLYELRIRFGWRSLFCNLLAVECAVAERDGDGFLYDGQGVTCNTITPLGVFSPPSADGNAVVIDFREGKKWKVQFRTLDTLMSLYKIQSVDFLKIDVEMAEFRVLDGAETTLSITKRIVVELHDRERKNELEQRLSRDFNHIEWLDDDHIYGH